MTALLSDDLSFASCFDSSGKRDALGVDIYCAAHLMMHQYGNNAELEAARCADQMLERGDRDELFTWFRIRRTIAVMRQAPAGLPN